MNKEYLEALKELKHWKETNNENGVVWLPLFAVEDIENALLKAKEQEKENGDIINLNKSLQEALDKPLLYLSRYGNKYIVPQKLLDELEQENYELKEHIKRWHDLLLKSGIDSKGIVADEMENYLEIKAGV